MTMPAVSPGQHPRHYAPRAVAFRFEDGARLPQDAAVLSASSDPADYARTFYARLRDLDAQSPAAIYIEMPPDTPEWAAIRDRIIRATQPWQ